MSAPPTIKFFTGKSELYAQSGRHWTRMPIEDEARLWTGLDKFTREHQLGVSFTQRQNKLFQVKFDLARINGKLVPAAIARLESKWRAESSAYSKSLQRSVSRRAHFARSFCVFEVLPENLADWERELRAVLEDLQSYEHNMEHDNASKS